jgi:hypothetical protein
MKAKNMASQDQGAMATNPFGGELRRDMSKFEDAYKQQNMIFSKMGERENYMQESNAPVPYSRGD